MPERCRTGLGNSLLGCAGVPRNDRKWKARERRQRPRWPARALVQRGRYPYLRRRSNQRERQLAGAVRNPRRMVCAKYLFRPESQRRVRSPPRRQAAWLLDSCLSTLQDMRVIKTLRYRLHRRVRHPGGLQRTNYAYHPRAIRKRCGLEGLSAFLLGYLGSCFLGLVQGLEFHHATRVNARSDLPIPGAVPKESVESVGTRYPDGRGVHLFCGTELFDRQATPPPGRIAASEPLHPVDPAPERCPS